MPADNPTGLLALANVYKIAVREGAASALEAYVEPHERGRSGRKCESRFSSHARAGTAADRASWRLGLGLPPAETRDRQPEVLGHAAVAVLLGLPDALPVGVPRLLVAAEPGEHVP